MRPQLYIAILLFFSACTAAKVSVPANFSSAATRYPVKGLNGWTVNQRLQMGDYSTSKIRRGWDMGNSLQYTRFLKRPEEMLLQVFNIDTDKKFLSQRNNFQYSIENGREAAEIFATEKFTEQDLVYKSNNPWLGDGSKTRRYDYSFSAAILPLTASDKTAWSLVLINRYDAAKDTARKLFDRPFVEEEGYATNGKETIAIRPLRLEDMKTKSGKSTKVFGGPLLAGYELRWDDGVVAIIDILDNSVWVANDLDNDDRIMIHSISSAILLKRMQDVEKDRDSL
jgi:hypothetical protein